MTWGYMVFWLQAYAHWIAHASSAWIGFSSTNDRLKITAFIRCSKHTSFCSSQRDDFSSLCDTVGGWGGKCNHLSMTHRLTTNCAKNYCNWTLIVKVIVENVVTKCFFETQCTSGHQKHKLRRRLQSGTGPVLPVAVNSTPRVHIKHTLAHRRIQRRLVISYVKSYGSRQWRKYRWISWNCWH